MRNPVNFVEDMLLVLRTGRTCICVGAGVRVGVLNLYLCLGGVGVPCEQAYCRTEEETILGVAWMFCFDLSSTQQMCEFAACSDL